jgi:hypothetical protein
MRAFPDQKRGGGSHLKGAPRSPASEDLAPKQDITNFSTLMVRKENCLQRGTGGREKPEFDLKIIF